MNKNVDDYKVVIITGENEKSDDKDGELIYVGNSKDYSFHIDALIDYSINKYPSVNVFKHINDRCLPCVPIFFLTWLNSIVYTNTSSDRIGKCGMLYMPDEISDKQKEVLLELSKTLPKSNVDIVYDMDFDDGEVIGTEFGYKRGQDFVDALNDFFKKNEKKTKR